jgi:hypothetical protein
LFNIAEEDTAGSPDQTASVLFNMLKYEFLKSHEQYITLEDHSYYEGRNTVDAVLSTSELTVLQMFANIEVPTIGAVAAGQELQAHPERAKEDPDFMELVREREPLDAHAGYTYASHAAWRISRQIVARGLARPFHAISLDFAPRASIHEAAEASFDNATKNTALYARALERLESGHNHLQLNAFSDDFNLIPDGSVSLLTLLDFFPIGFKIPEDATSEEIGMYRLITLEAAERWYSKLRLKGRMVIFTWDVADKTAVDEELLDDMLRLWDRQGADISMKVYSRDRIYSWMSEAERLFLATRSPLFKTDFDLFKVLVVQKVRRPDIPPDEGDDY